MMSATSATQRPSSSPVDLQGHVAITLWTEPLAASTTATENAVAKYQARRITAVQCRSARPNLAPLLLRGRPLSSAPSRLGQVFAGCGRAQSWAAELIIQAYQHHEADLPRKTQQALAYETVQAHVQALARQLSAVHDPGSTTTAWPMSPWTSLPWALACDTKLAAEDQQLRARQAIADWFSTACLGQSIAEWNAARRVLAPRQRRDNWWRRLGLKPFEAEPVLSDDERAHPSLPPPALTLPDAPEARRAWLQALAQRALDEPGYVAAPVDPLSNRPCQTGPACRQAENEVWPDPSWRLLLARLDECAQLLAPSPATPNAAPLQAGALRLSSAQDVTTLVSWLAMSRGWLMQVARVRTARDAGKEAQILDWQVIAPTEWLFHPEGVVAHSLNQQLRGRVLKSVNDEIAAQQWTHTIATCFDPCVPIHLALQPR